MKRTSFLKFISIALVSIIILTATVGIWFLVNNYDRYGIYLFLPKYAEKHACIKTGFGDSIEYVEYHYSETTITKFANNTFLKEVTLNNIEDVVSYFENFKSRIEYSGLKDQYFFDTSQIKPGDLCFIYTMEGASIGKSSYGKYDSYDVYYVDMEKHIMYYIHSNI